MNDESWMLRDSLCDDGGGDGDDMDDDADVGDNGPRTKDYWFGLVGDYS